MAVRSHRRDSTVLNDHGHSFARAAEKRGDQHYEQMGARLGVSRATAWRLWQGRTAPAATTLAAIHREYDLHAYELTIRTVAA